MDINTEDETSYTTQPHKAVPNCVGNEEWAKHRRVPVNINENLPMSNLIPSEMVLGSCQSTFDPYVLSCDNGKYVTPNNAAESPPGRSDPAAHLLTAARIHLTSPP